MAPTPDAPSSEARRPSWLRRAAGPAVVLAILGLQAAAIHQQSLSGDGAQHLLAGQHALFFGQNLHNLEHPPLVKLVAALPALAMGEPLAPPVLPREAVAATDRMHRDGERVWRATVAGRWAVLAAFGVPLLMACFFLGRRFGAGWMLVALVGLSFSIVPWISSLQTDTAVACGFLLTLLAGLRWRESPTPGRAAVVGAALGLAAASKFSGLLLVPVVLMLAGMPAAGLKTQMGWRRRLGLPLLAFPVAALLVLATYAAANWRYDAETGREVIRQYCRSEGTLVTGDRMARWEGPLLDLERHLPLTAQWATGVLGVAAQDSIGVYPSYVLGEVSSRGRWWYFPLALLVKMPLVLLAAAAALALAGLKPRAEAPRRTGWPGWEARLVAATVVLYLGIAMSSSYNIGLRHLFPVIPLLLLPVAAALARRPGWAMAAGAALLVESVAVAPHWLAATNTWWLGEHNPTRLALGSGDLEFRQNLWQLAGETRRRKLDNLGVLYFGLHDDVLRAYVPTARLVRPGEPIPPGWYAVNAAMEQLIPGILHGDPAEIYQYRERRAIAREWRRPWRRVRSGEDHGWMAGTFHLYRVGGQLALPARPHPPAPSPKGEGETSQAIF